MKNPSPRVISIIERTGKPHISMIGGSWCVAASRITPEVLIFPAVHFINDMNAQNKRFSNGQRGLI